jgi:hypothetical protein
MMPDISAWLPAPRAPPGQQLLRNCGDNCENPLMRAASRRDTAAPGLASIVPQPRLPFGLL